MNIRIEKRVPFGFKGKWGKCYKLTNFNNVNGGITIIYQDNTYYDIGYDVQFKYLENGVDKTLSNSTPIANLVTKGEFRLVKTTDAYFNINTNEYECVVQPNDIVKVFGDWWICEKIEDRSIYTPEKQTFYYLSLKKIFDKVVEDLEYENNNATIIDVYNTVEISLMVNQANSEVVVDWGDGQKETHISGYLFNHNYLIPTTTRIKVYCNSDYNLDMSGVKNIKNIKLDKYVTSGEFANSSIQNFEFSTGIKTIKSYMFQNIINLKTLIIPRDVTKIERYSCIYCEDLENVEINASVTSLGGSMFVGCSKLKNVKLPNNLETLSAETFMDCVSLEHITIPINVISIGGDAFLNCPLKTMELKPFVPPRLNYPEITRNIETIYIPQGTLRAYQEAWSDYADKFVEK